MRVSGWVANPVVPSLEEGMATLTHEVSKDNDRRIRIFLLRVFVSSCLRVSRGYGRGAKELADQHVPKIVVHGPRRTRGSDFDCAFVLKDTM